MVPQSYTVNLVDENVLRGNSAAVKCLIPSFVSEFVGVTAWIVTQDGQSHEVTDADGSLPCVRCPLRSLTALVPQSCRRRTP